MKLILEAIKALFRKVECGFSDLRAYVDSKVSAESKQLTTNIRVANRLAGDAAEMAGDAAETASVALSRAATADTKATDAQTAATYTFNASISGNHATLINCPGLFNGRIYVVVPAQTSNNTGYAYVVVNGKSVRVLPGVQNRTTIGVSSSYYLAANALFLKNEPVALMYCAEDNVFYCLNHGISQKPLETSVATVDNGAPTYYYGRDHLYNGKLFKYMRVKSSTEGSTKLFDIQVDDEGKLQTVDMDGNVVPAGGADWNAAEGEAGHVLNRTHWIEDAVLLEKTSASMYTHPEFGTAFEIVDKDIPWLTTGKSYTVTFGWDSGEESYVCVCQDAPKGLSYDSNAKALGNFSVVGGPDTGEPFAILIAHYPDRLDVINLKGGSTATVEIREDVYHAIDARFLPSDTGFPNPHKLTFTGSIAAEYDGSKAVEVAVKAAQMRQLFYHDAGPGDNSYAIGFDTSLHKPHEIAVYAQIKSDGKSSGPVWLEVNGQRVTSNEIVGGLDGEPRVYDIQWRGELLADGKFSCLKTRAVTGGEDGQVMLSVPVDVGDAITEVRVFAAIHFTEGSSIVVYGR